MPVNIIQNRQSLKMKIISLKRTDSTNNYTKELASKTSINHFTCFSTTEQTAGKGQGKNSWYSKKNESLTFSIFLKPNITAQNQFIISKVISLGIIDFLNNFKAGFKIKWPNDIYFQNKKICGVLIENTLSGKNINQCIVGIGININHQVFPKDLPNPISLFQITNNKYSEYELLNNLLTDIHKRYNELEVKNHDTIDKEYLKNLYRYKMVSRFSNFEEEFSGIITGLGEYGKLKVQNRNTRKEKEYDLKEIVFLD